MSDTAEIDVRASIDCAGFGRYQVLIVGLCMLVVMFDGYDTQSIGYVAPLMAKDIDISVASFGPIFAAGLFGSMLGAMAFGKAKNERKQSHGPSLMDGRSLPGAGCRRNGSRWPTGARSRVTTMRFDAVAIRAPLLATRQPDEGRRVWLWRMSLGVQYHWDNQRGSNSSSRRCLCGRQPHTFGLYDIGHSGGHAVDGETARGRFPAAS
jgi:hypothetical protein